MICAVCLAQNVSRVVNENRCIARAKCLTNEGIVYEMYELGMLLMLYVGCEVPYSLHLGAQ